MDAPPVQYVRTPDGYDIAYTVCGDGPPFVFYPPIFFNNVREMWKLSAQREMFEALASRFTLVQFDHRGQGMSTRALKVQPSGEEYQFDFDAVVERLRLGPFVIFAAAFM